MSFTCYTLTVYTKPTSTCLVTHGGTRSHCKFKSFKSRFLKRSPIPKQCGFFTFSIFCYRFHALDKPSGLYINRPSSSFFSSARSHIVYNPNNGPKLVHITALLNDMAKDMHYITHGQSMKDCFCVYLNGTIERHQP